MNKLAVALAVSGLCVPLTAQWLNYPTPGIPRTPDGKPNLAAPAPRRRRMENRICPASGGDRGWEATIGISRET